MSSPQCPAQMCAMPAIDGVALVAAAARAVVQARTPRRTVAAVAASVTCALVGVGAKAATPQPHIGRPAGAPPGAALAAADAGAADDAPALLAARRSTRAAQRRRKKDRRRAGKEAAARPAHEQEAEGGGAGG